jgi:GH24 family phage-related lysozyme (muramidase)
MSRLRPEEGFRSFCYRDSRGHLTVAWGFLLEPADEAARRLVWLLGITDAHARQIIAGMQAVTAEQGLRLLEYTARCAVTDAADVVGPEAWSRLPDDAHLVLADVAFNQGPGDDHHGLRSYHKMLAALREDPPDFARAQAELLDSDGARTNKARYEELGEFLGGCATPPTPEDVA